MDKYFYFQQKSLNKSTSWLLFLLLGWCYGSYNQMTKQILFYLTLGGFGLWTIYKIFTLNRDIDNYNRQIAKDLGFSISEIEKLGL